MLFIVIIMGVGSSATKEGQRTSSIVHKILNRNLKKEVDRKVINIKQIHNIY